MKLTCPACGAVASLDVLLAHDDARAAVAAAMHISAPLAAQLLRYLALFRPDERSLTMARTATLLNELLPMIQEARVTRNGRAYIAPVDTWKLALDEMLAKRARLTLPLKSHGYLLEIIAGMGEKQEAAVETRREQIRAHGHSQDRSTAGVVPLKSVIPDSVRAEFGRYVRKPTTEEAPDGNEG